MRLEVTTIIKWAEEEEEDDRWRESHHLLTVKKWYKRKMKKIHLSSYMLMEMIVCRSCIPHLEYWFSMSGVLNHYHYQFILGGKKKVAAGINPEQQQKKEKQNWFLQNHHHHHRHHLSLLLDPQRDRTDGLTPEIIHNTIITDSWS